MKYYIFQLISWFNFRALIIWFFCIENFLSSTVSLDADLNTSEFMHYITPPNIIAAALFILIYGHLSYKISLSFDTGNDNPAFLPLDI